MLLFQIWSSGKFNDENRNRRQVAFGDEPSIFRFQKSQKLQFNFRRNSSFVRIHTKFSLTPGALFEPLSTFWSVA